jgi:hypothetical protein
MKVNPPKVSQGSGASLPYLVRPDGHGSGVAYGPGLICASIVLNPRVKCQLARVVFHFSFHILSGSGPKRRGESSCYLNEMSEDPCTRRLPLFAQIEAYT